jgi:hypothetical protein
MFHADIGRAEPYAHERALGWIEHYVIGAIYGVVFALLAGPEWFAAPRILPAWMFGVATSLLAGSYCSLDSASAGPPHGRPTRRGCAY